MLKVKMIDFLLPGSGSVRLPFGKLARFSKTQPSPGPRRSSSALRHVPSHSKNEITAALSTNSNLGAAQKPQAGKQIGKPRSSYRELSKHSK